MLKSVPNRPAIHPAFCNVDRVVTLAGDSMPAEGRNPGNFVGWAYQCLHSSAMSAEASAKLHDTLLLRTLSIPEMKPPPVALWNKLFNAKRYPGTRGERLGRKLKLVPDD